MAKLVDALDLGSSGVIHGGSSPLPPMNFLPEAKNSYPERPLLRCLPRGNNKTMWHVYIIKCSDGSYYTGITRNLQQRIKRHQEGNGASYTRIRRPIELRYAETFAD